ncbi:MAG TPA: zinc-dependent metalloprotease [Actinomycetes bacterium]|nr:zinc-dependent metalloprotease [Actinomycetes bacterium]
MVDWDLAVATGSRLVPAGPPVSREEAREAVAQLRAFAVQAQDHVRDYTGLVAPGDGGAVAVIDRPGWIRANAAGFRAVIDPLEERLQERRSRGGALGPGPWDAVGPKVTGVQTGSLLAFLATKVLGQYDLFSTYDESPGRLLLVAPNIVAAEREMGVDPADFRLWVCLHEETHRVQFGAVPWLREHVLGEIRAYLEATDVDPAAMARRLRDGLGAVVEALRGSEGTGMLLEAVQTPAQREILDRLTAVMSLLEGHADVVMDGVGPDVIPSVAAIRERFQRRRQGRGWADQLTRRLLGLDAKMRQYRDGAAFVRQVVDQVGRDGFNAVWSSPAALPTRAEVLAPASWVARVVG